MLAHVLREIGFERGRRCVARREHDERFDDVAADLVG